jgi:hypothetical protein
MGARERVMTGAGVVGVVLLMTGCSSGGSSFRTTTATTPASQTADTAVAAVAAVTNLAPACPSSGTPASSDAIQDGGTHTYYSFATSDYASIVTGCNRALSGAGWTVASTGNSGYGPSGGGGSTVTEGARYATFDVGSSGARTYLDVCVWPAKPVDTDCGQNGNGSNGNGNDNQSNAGNQGNGDNGNDDQSNQN